MSRGGAGDRVRLVLAGAGHTHVEVLRRLGGRGGAELRRRIELTVVSTPRFHLYSGMVPGYLAGRYRRDEITVDAAALTRRADGRFVEARVVGLDPHRRLLRLAGGGIEWDLVSVAVGGTAAAGDLPGVREHAARVTPIVAAADLRRRLDELAERGGGAGRGGPHVLVVGGGAGGVEVAFAAAAVLAPVGGRVTLAEDGEAILDGYGRRFVRLAGRALAERGVEVRTGCRVTAVDAGGAELGGGRIGAGLVVWATGAAGRPWLAESGLPVDRRGFLLVDRALRSTGDPRVLAGGDCAVLADVPDLPRAGVYAVREAPVLWRSLSAAVLGGEPPRFEPQRRFLSLLNTADGRALLSWRGLAFHARWAWWLKDWIDRRYVRRYQRLYV